MAFNDFYFYTKAGFPTGFLFLGGQRPLLPARKKFMFRLFFPFYTPTGNTLLLANPLPGNY
jgi:hypothetical protein